MAINYGSGVSRVLDPKAAAFLTAIHQQGKPPTDAEINLLQDIQNEWNRLAVLRGTPSGFLGNETNPYADYQTRASWSNWFKFGRQRTGETQSITWAVVNGWLIPVTGTRTGTPPGSPNDLDSTNVIALDPPPSNSGDFRIDFAFLEVWLARVPASPSTQNKPASTALWKYGNVEGGASFLPDNLVDPNLGFETTQRVQVQYRIRVVKGLVGLSTNPDGFDSAVVKAQGAATTPTSFTFSNMRSTLGDPGLWRAGDGTTNALGTVDGYVYAIPICVAFRRNSVAWSGDPAQNLNGGFNRNPTATDRTGILTFSTSPTLVSGITSTAVSFNLVSSTNIPLPVSPATPVLIKVGNEYMTYTSITGTTLNGVTRGVNGSVAEPHPAGASVQVVSGRPDGLFSDQIALTDILDLRHLVNPNGFDYEALLRTNIDKLVRGQLRGTWKRTGAGPQGPLVHYQDKISTGSASLGVTKIDGPDNIRMVYSDAAVLQPISIVAKAGTTTSATVAWSLSLTVNHTVKATNNNFTAGDRLVIPIAQFKNSLGTDSDQIRFLAPSDATGAVEIYIDGETTPISAGQYTVTPDSGASVFGPNDDMRIEFGGAVTGFPTQRQLYIKLHVMYGPGRGLARRPDILHTVSYLTANADIMTAPQAVPSTNLPLQVSWAPLWTRYRKDPYRGAIPVTNECYLDPGSKTLILQPYRRITWPTEFKPMDGTAVNVAPATLFNGTNGVSNNTMTFTSAGSSFDTSAVGAFLFIASGAAAGTYLITAAPSSTQLTVATPVPTATGITYTVKNAQGLMPLKDVTGTGAVKWVSGKTDPLGLFSGTQDPTAETKNLYVTLPRHLVPGWGALHIPILPLDAGNFDEGINFMFLSTKKAPPFDASEKNYVPYGGNGALTYAVFSTKDFNPPGNPAPYNDTFTFGGTNYCGMRFFNDTRGLGRRGLELPPFYGVARLFAVYEAVDYQNNGSSYNQTTRDFTGSGAKNLLRQSFDGPTMWIEIDEDGDSTFILNADALELSKSPNPISSFTSGQYVIEANIFGFDRGAFDLNQPCRIVLTRAVVAATNNQMRDQAHSATRSSNIASTNQLVALTGPVSVLPGPAFASDQVVINYSRTPYQGDAWGSQTSNLDIGHTPGPLQSGTAFQIASTTLDSTSLTRPNQKALEVLTSIGFETTLGTGRISGDTAAVTAFDFRNVGYEDPASYPPTASNSDRPRVLMGGLAQTIEVGTDYHGCTERLPLGALYRDKDFRGGATNVDGSLSPFVYIGNTAVGALQSGLSVSPSTELVEALASTASNVTGAAGDIAVHVDGEQGNYTILTNFRTNRGGSAFNAGGVHQGGEILSHQGTTFDTSARTNVISGRAYLVRNTVTTVGSNEVSAGDELMMLVITNAQSLTAVSSVASVRIGTNGTSEGSAAADLYRIEGHPLICHNTKVDVDPTTITLTSKVS